ncbi:DUF4158 domain-containing protein [Streptosporangium roseum]|uniref:DUF4158 domain-containing protein n=1 Tax=Streptosporangium roseum TaxID=2001 RepID=UPI00332CDF90
MSEKMFSEDQLEQLRSFPDIGRDDLIGYFTLAPSDLAFVDPGRGRGPTDRLGLAVQLSTLQWLGFVPDDVVSAPPVAVARLAEQLQLDPVDLEGYGQRSHTRSDHLRLAASYLSWKSAPAGGMAMKELEQFLLDRAMEHDSPTLLFNLAREYLIASKVIRPGAIILAKMVGTARAGASELTTQLVGHLLTEQMRSDLDRLLVLDVGLGMTRLAWLVKPAVEASASAVKTSIDKLALAEEKSAGTIENRLAKSDLQVGVENLGARCHERRTPCPDGALAQVRPSCCRPSARTCAAEDLLTRGNCWFMLNQALFVMRVRIAT